MNALSGRWGYDFRVARALRAADHDGMAVMEIMPDQAAIDVAVREERVLLTEDRDFG